MVNLYWVHSDAYLEHVKHWRRRLFAKIVDGFFHFFLEISSINAWEGLNHLSANPTKCSNTFKQFVGKLPTSCVSACGHFVEFAIKGLNKLLTFAILVSKLTEVKHCNTKTNALLQFSVLVTQLWTVSTRDSHVLNVKKRKTRI